jgi:hypothetical protein
MTPPTTEAGQDAVHKTRYYPSFYIRRVWTVYSEARPRSMSERALHCPLSALRSTHNRSKDTAVIAISSSKSSHPSL